MSEQQPGDRAMFWFNVVGITLATALLGAFFWIAGLDLFAFIVLMLTPQDHWPDR